MTGTVYLFGGFFSRVGGSTNRIDVHPRANFARLLPGTTRGPGNVSFTGDTFGGDENGGSLSLSLQRINGDFGAAQAFLQTVDGTATAPDDYKATSKTVTWPASNGVKGQTNTMVVSVPLVDDTLIEGDETFDVSTTLPFGYLTLGGQFVPAGLALDSPAKVTAVIVDNDVSVSILNFSTNSYSIDEGAGSVNIAITRTGNSDATVSVRYSTVDGTGSTGAKAGIEYTAVSGSVTFKAGQTNQTFSIPIVNDSKVNPDKIFSARLTNPSSGAQLGATNATALTAGITIIDNDYAPGHVAFVTTNFPRLKREARSFPSSGLEAMPEFSR